MTDLFVYIAAIAQIILGVCAFLLLLVSIPMMAANLFKMRWHIQTLPGRSPRLEGNRFNVMFFPENLAPEGLIARQEFFYWLKCAMAGALCGLASAALALAFPIPT
jgi:hypothetical protein